MERKESKDVTQKNLESYPDVVADILNVFIHKGEQRIRPSALYPAPTETEYVVPDSALRSQLEDVSKYEMQDGKIQVQYLLANQTVVDYKMILRKASYEGAVYRGQYDGKVQDAFPVVSLLLYWGEGQWGRKRSIREFFKKKKLSPRLLELVDDYRLHVFEMRNLTPEIRSLFQSDMRHVADYLAKGNSFRSDHPVIHKEALVRLLRALSGDTNVEDTAEILHEMNVKEEEDITMCELFDQYEKRGLQKGMQALISTCHELGVSFDETAAKVKEKFSLAEEDALKNMLLYW